jgi:cytochrome P450
MPRLQLPPGPTRRHPGEFILAIRRDPLGFFGRVARDHGDIAHLRVGTQRVYLLGHPDLVKDLLVTQQKNFTKGRGLERARMLLGNGLLTSEGEDHLHQRRLVQPAFHRDRIAGYTAVMSAYAERQMARWRDGDTRDIGREMMDLTLRIAAKTLFDADVEGETAEIGEALTTALGLFNFAVLPFSELIERLPLGPGARFRRARRRLDATIYRIIEERRARPADRGDLLSMLLVAQDAEGDGSGLTDTQLRDEVMTLLLAGHETTSNLLTWTWYLLAGHPEVVVQVEAELDGALAGRGPTAADLPSLRYTRMVLSEAMRLYPPAWILGRRVRRAGPGDRARQPVPRAPRSAVLAAAGAFRSGAVAAVARRGRETEVRVLSVRRRNATMHRGGVCLGGSDAAARRHRALLADAPRARSPG